MATLVACAGDLPPDLSALEDQVAQVGTELTITIEGTDPDGDHLEYGFSAADLPDIGARARLTVSPSGSGVFRWTPLAADVGVHAFDFTANDGDDTTTVTIAIDVRSAIGSATAPVFIQPAGTGTTIDLASTKCVELEILIQDQDTAELTIAQEEPRIPGATLTQETGSTARWEWCPTAEQEAVKRNTLVISVDDGDNPKVLKTFLVVLRSNTGGACPGAAPTIEHAPANATTILDLTIDARVRDDKGLKDTPLFYVSQTRPSEPPDLSRMTQLTTIKIDGTAADAVYAADVPNPVAGLPAGAQRTLFYVFVADDDDDAAGSCDHSTISEVFEMTVTAAGSEDLNACASCSADAQCGEGDLCVFVGSTGQSRCLQDCDDVCPSGYTCSNEPVFSVDGASARQCVPQSGSCEAPAGACEDDLNEEDDSRAAAAANAQASGPLAPGVQEFVSCPKSSPVTSGSRVDDDWFQIVVDRDTQLDLYILGTGESDLDLTLFRANETEIARSASFEAEENIVECVPAGTYFVKVNGFDAVRSTYLLDYAPTAQACN